MVEDYIEFEKDTKKLKKIVLDEMSIVELQEYIQQLNIEIKRVCTEIEKKNKFSKTCRKSN